MAPTLVLLVLSRLRRFKTPMTDCTTLLVLMLLGYFSLELHDITIEMCAKKKDRLLVTAWLPEVAKADLIIALLLTMAFAIQFYSSVSQELAMNAKKAR